MLFSCCGITMRGENVLREGNVMFEVGRPGVKYNCG
jgi:hypothetical protein